jgi:cyanophycin synthetase
VPPTASRSRWQNGNLSTGGTSKDVTDQVHQEVAELCRRAAAVTGLDICGIDLRLEDISAPLFAPSLAGYGRSGGRRQAAAVIEINACPGLRMHLTPAEGTGRRGRGHRGQAPPAGRDLADPDRSVTGTNGKTTTVDDRARLGQAYLRTGASRHRSASHSAAVLEADASGPRSA